MDDTIILDLTPHEWQCGSADDEGPAEILPAVEDPAERKSQLAYVLEQLEVERAEFKVLLSEQPGASTGPRAHRTSPPSNLFLLPTREKDES